MSKQVFRPEKLTTRKPEQNVLDFHISGNVEYRSEKFNTTIKKSRLRLTRVKNAVRMHAFPASGANLHVPPPIEIIRDTKTN